MSLIQRLFGASTDATILCPRCERALEGHDDAACARKMSRRWFIGATVGAVAAIAATQEPVREIMFGGVRAGGRSQAARALNLMAGDRLSISFDGTPAFHGLSVALETIEPGPMKMLLGIPVGSLTEGSIYIAPTAMRVTGIHWSVAQAGLMGSPSIKVVRSAT